MGHDRIEFRRVPTQDEAYGPSTVDVVETYINGRPLTDLWSRASREGGRWVRAADALWAGRRLWTDDALANSELVQGERRVVLVCVDGLTGCGGATAKVELSERSVEWSDFRTVPSERSVPLGPFVFDREQYDKALAKVERGNR